MQRPRREVVQAANGAKIEGAGFSASTLLWWARRQAGITQSELAELLGRHSRTIAHWEEERQSIPTNDWLEALQRCGYQITLELVEDE